MRSDPAVGLGPATRALGDHRTAVRGGRFCEGGARPSRPDRCASAIAGIALVVINLVAVLEVRSGRKAE